jgi:hypothetical protein
MNEVAPEPELAALLANYGRRGGVIDYIVLESTADGPVDRLHGLAALAGMAAIGRRWEQWAVEKSSPEFPAERFFRVRWDEAKLTGQPVTLSTFWGTDDVEPKDLGGRAWSIPTVDGYKTAFFHPPHHLGGPNEERAALFANINRRVLGTAPESAEIFSWSTDWSNYFDAGHEWWGAFFWTVRASDSSRFVAIGASSTD